MIRIRASAPTEFNAPIVGDPDGRCESDALRIGGDYTPGVCVVRRAGIPITWDKRKGYGYAGAWLIYTGDDLAEFETEFTFWRQDQIDAWKLWAKSYLTKPPASPQLNGSFLPNVPKPKALGVYHPVLAELGITQIVPKHIGQFSQPSLGKWTKVVEWYQFRAPKPSLGRPKEAIPDTQKKAPTAQDAQDLEMRSHDQRIDALVKGIATGHN